jgi:glutathione S-transferase
MITLYQYEMSPFCTKVALILRFKQIAHEIVEVPISKSASVKTYSSTSKLPVIEHRGRCSDGSTEIAQYLEEHFPTPGLVLENAQDRAQCHIYEDWADESLNFYMMKLCWLPQNRRRWATELAKHDTGLWRWLISTFIARATLNILDKQGIGRKSETDALADLDRHMCAIAARLDEGGFLVGEQLSLADISVYSQLFWVGKNPEGRKAISAYSRITDWMQCHRRIFAHNGLDATR